MGEKVGDVVPQRLHWAEGEVARQSLPKGFAARAILLVSVGEGDVGPSLHVMQRTVAGWDALDEGAAECGVGQAEGFAAAAIGGGGQGVLARSAEEEEGEGGEVENGLGAGLITVG